MKKQTKLYLGDNMESLKLLPDNSIDSIVTDPPYGLSFMNKKWDYQVPSVEFWELVYKKLKPGGHVLSFGGTRTYHRMVVNIEDAGFEIRDQIMWIYGCLDKTTELLTKRGWLKYNELTYDDYILSWNSSLDILEFQKPSNINIKPYSGEMVVLKNKHTDQLLTPNHRVYCKYERKDRGYIGDKYEVVEAGDMKLSGKYNLPLSSYLDGPGIGGEDYATLLGWIWSEGEYDKKGNSIRISQSSVNQPYVDEIKSLLDKMNIEYSHYTRIREYNYKHKGIQEYVDNSFYFTTKNELNKIIRNDLLNKKLTLELILKMSIKEKEAFVKSAHKGDGSKNRTTIYQSGREQQDLLQFLFHTIGQTSTINEKKIAVNFRNSRTTQLQHGKLNKKEIYDDIVWCPTIDNGAFMARRNGKIFITGNSGFPKSHNIGKSYDKKVGNDREEYNPGGRYDYSFQEGNSQFVSESATGSDKRVNILPTKGTSPHEGWGTALKPAQEIIAVAQKPEDLEGTVLNLIYIIKNEIWKLYVNVVEQSSELNQVEQKEVLNTAQCLVEKNINIQDALQGLMDMSQLKLMENMNWNTVLLWQSILEGVYQKMNRYTTSTKSNLIIDLKTLKSLEWQNILVSIMQVNDNQINGQNVNALTAVVLFNALNLKLKDIYTHSVEDNVIYKEDNSDCLNEPICVARKPLSEKTIVDNVIKWGTGGINVDGCRIGFRDENDKDNTINAKYTTNIDNKQSEDWGTKQVGNVSKEEGRFPANIIFDESAAAMLDEQSGERIVGKGNRSGGFQKGYIDGDVLNRVNNEGYNDKGGASRFFFKVMDETNIEKKDITNKTLCGTITEKKKVDGILDGVKMEIEKYILNANQFISGNKEMENYQVDVRYTISILIKLMTELKTYNVLQEQNIEDYTQNLIKTILLLMEKSIEDVKNVESIKNYMTSIKLIESMLDMEVIVNVVRENTYKNGEVKTENTITNTTENIGSNCRFFYVPKVSKKERNMGLDGFECEIKLTPTLKLIVKTDYNNKNLLWEKQDLKTIHADTDKLHQKDTEEYGVPQNEDKLWNIDMYGNYIMERFQQDFKSITEMEINSTTIYQTLNLLIQKNTKNYIQELYGEKVKDINFVENVEKKNMKMTFTLIKDIFTQSVSHVSLEEMWSVSVKENKSNHPTLKPINLMTYLCRLVTPPNGIVLDPFMGSGSTGISALLEGFRFVGMEMDEDYFKICEARIENYEEYRTLLKK